MNKKYNVSGREIDFFFNDGDNFDRYYNEVIVAEEYADCVPPGDGLVVIDIGASLGTFSAWIYDRAKVIYAAEPARSNMVSLLSTVACNGLHKIKLSEAAIAKEDGYRYLKASGDAGGYSIVDANMQNHCEAVPAQTLNGFLEARNLAHVDLCKIDAEGAEGEIFLADDFHLAAPKLPWIVGELHGNGTGCVETLEAHGYTVEIRKAHGSNATLFLAKR